MLKGLASGVMIATIVCSVLFLRMPDANATIISGGISNFTVDVQNAAANSVYIFIPDTSSIGKAPGVSAANPIDLSSTGYVLSLIRNPQIVIKDTDPTYVVTSTGQPNYSNIPVAAKIVAIGGPGVNNVVHYFESVDPLLGGATARFFATATNAGWTAYGATVAQLYPPYPLSSVGNLLDAFVIESFKNSGGGDTYLLYGIGGFGTMAAAVYLRFCLYPDLSPTGTCPGVIGGLEGDGAAGTSTKNTYMVLWQDASSGTSANNIPDFNQATTKDVWTMLAKF